MNPQFTLRDILHLINPTGELDDQIIIADRQHDVENKWSVLPMNSKLLLVPENLDRKVKSIGIWDEMFQIWLADEG